jgi:alpha 1,2-mannosyltransferase
MLAQFARKPLARWGAVAAIFIIVLLWSSGAPDNISFPRIGTSTPAPKGPQTEGGLTNAGGDGRDKLEVPNVVANPSVPDVVLDTRPNEQDAHHFPEQPALEETPDHGTTDTSSEKDSSKQTSGQGTPNFPTASSSGQFQHADEYLSHFQSILTESPMSIKQTKTTCHWDSIDDVDFQYADDSEWVQMDRSDAEIAERQKHWHDFVKNDMIPYSDVADKFNGKGIVVCAGNERSMYRLMVLLRMLLHLESKLPVEVHYYGDGELSPENRENLKKIYPNLYFNDLEGPDVILNTKHENFWINYNVKLASLLNSRFAEPMLLDSDNVPVSDPMKLYESDTYQTFGTVFWPDIARTRPQNPMWAITNTPCRPDEYEMESGQLLVDKKRFWYHLQLAAWFGHQDYYQKFLLGDKDCFRFAWHALKTPYGRPARWLTSVGFVQRPSSEPPWPQQRPEVSAGQEDEKEKYSGGPKSKYCGHSFGQHYPDGIDAPIQFMHGGLLKTLNNEQIIHSREHGHGLFGAYKQSVKADIVRTSPFPKLPSKLPLTSLP